MPEIAPAVSSLPRRCVAVRLSSPGNASRSRLSFRFLASRCVTLSTWLRLSLRTEHLIGCPHLARLLKSPWRTSLCNSDLAGARSIAKPPPGSRLAWSSPSPLMRKHSKGCKTLAQKPCPHPTEVYRGLCSRVPLDVPRRRLRGCSSSCQRPRVDT